MAKRSEEPTKKCWNCFERAKIRDTKCSFCGKTLGPPNNIGIAKQPFDWKAYGLSLISGGALIYFLYWLFVLKD